MNQIELYDKSLKDKLLSAELIRKDFIQTINKNGLKKDIDCNYEHYLIELVNHSNFFLKLSHGEHYVSPIRESNGECDCISDNYQLDFKLFGGNSPFYARKLTSNRKYYDKRTGAIIVCSPEKENEEILVTRIHAALRNYSYDDLCTLSKKDIKIMSMGIEKDICSTLDLLKTKKNILVFFPFSFSFDTEYNLEEGAVQIKNALNTDFSNIMKYRHNMVSNFETFLCFIYSDYLVVLKHTEDNFDIVDYVSLRCSPKYMKLFEISRI